MSNEERSIAKRPAWDMLGALEELCAKPIWSAAQRAELVARYVPAHMLSSLFRPLWQLANHK
jgi:hypothetical protein